MTSQYNRKRHEQKRHVITDTIRLALLILALRAVMTLAIARQSSLHARAVFRRALLATGAANKSLLLPAGGLRCPSNGESRVARRCRHVSHSQEVGAGELYLVLAEQAVQWAELRPDLKFAVDCL